jgi:ubiquinone/menaquinone biosynthesis C-methylase UbiE
MQLGETVMTAPAERREHWNAVYGQKAPNQVSWFQQTPEPSVGLIKRYAGPAASVIDVGGGASNLVDGLLQAGFHDLTVLDLSAAALDVAKQRLGPSGSDVAWLVADATSWTPTRTYEVWHDRAALHFLTEESQRQAYVERLTRALEVGGHAIIATFALDGPEKCSGLPVVRHDAASLSRLFGPSFDCLGTQRHNHETPWQTAQAFQFSVFRKVK